MKHFLILTLLACPPLFAEGPVFQHKDTATQQEFENVYQDLRSTLGTNGNSRCIDSPTLCVDVVNHRVGISTGTPAFPIDMLASNTNAMLRLNNTSGRGAIIRFDSSATQRGYLGVEGQYLASTSQNMTFASQSNLTLYTNGGTTPALFLDTANIVTSSAVTTSSQLQLYNTGGRGSTIAFMGNNTAAQGFVGMEGVYLGNTNQNITIAGNSNRSVNIYTDGNATASVVVGTTTMGVGIKGVTNGTNARSGDVGEYVTSYDSSNAALAASGVYDDLTSITLSAGDWEIEAICTGSVSTSTVYMEIGISTSSGNNSSNLNRGNTSTFVGYGSASFLAVGGFLKMRVKPIASTIYYYKRGAVYTSGTLNSRGTLSARRVR